METADSRLAVRRMQEYIETHIDGKITLDDLAAAAGYSPWHAARLFRDITGKSPLAYIRALRLTGAARVLRDTQEKVLDVALDHAFDSHEGFTRAFTREFGLTPRAYSRDTPPIRWFLPYKIPLETKGDTGMSDCVKPVFIRPIERPARKLLLRRGVEATEYFAYCGEVGCDVWAILCSVKEALSEPVGMWLPPSLIRPGTSPYVQAVELPADYAGAVPEGFELVDAPAYTLLQFQGEPYDDDAFEQAIGEMWSFIDRFRPESFGYRWAPEAGPRIQFEPRGERGYIEARPVEPLS